MKEYTVVTRDGLKVGVAEGGRGIPLVFIHGFSVSTRAYAEMLELLADNGFHVLALDAPDHGRSDPLPWGHTVSDMVDVLEQALLQIPTLEGARATIAGHSMGGWLAAELAARPRISSFSFDTLILMNAAVGETFHEATRLGGPGLLKRGAQFLAGALKDVFADAKQARSLRRLSDRLRLYDMLRGSVSGAACLRAAHAMMLGDSAPALRALRYKGTQIHIVHGDLDTLIPSEAAINAWHELGPYNTNVVLHAVHDVHHSWMIADPQLALNVINGCVGLDTGQEAG